MAIVKNAIKCAHCGAEIESRHRHDFVTHSCDGLEDGFIAVDGGRAYLRRVGDQNDWIDISEYSEPEVPYAVQQ